MPLHWAIAYMVGGGVIALAISGVRAQSAKYAAEERERALQREHEEHIRKLKEGKAT